jgi:hypothetical protein
LPSQRRFDFVDERPVGFHPAQLVLGRLVRHPGGTVIKIAAQQIDRKIPAQRPHQVVGQKGIIHVNRRVVVFETGEKIAPVDE